MTAVRSLAVPGLCGQGLYFEVDGFRLVYLAVAVLMWVASGVFSLEYMAHYAKRKRYYLFFWATFLATAGVFLSADFMTTFVFFEAMSFTSYVWVAFDERKESLRAAETYLAVAVTGGMVMLMGLFLLQDLCGSLAFGRVAEVAEGILAGSKSLQGGAGMACALGSPKKQLYVAGGLLLFGFGAKAGCFPLHIWLPKAHPVAPAPASALLSGILTKAGVFGMIVVSCGMFREDPFWGTGMALLGLATMFVGALLALFSVNLKRTLACSSVSQIGFIVTGIGVGGLLRAAGEDGGLAVRGAMLHMVNHSLFKLVLFLCAAVVFMNLHQLDLNEIRGFGRRKPLLLFCFLMGALGLGGVPLWSGYVSKTLLHEGIAEYAAVAAFPAFWRAAEWVFLISGGMTVAYMAKLFFALFVERHPTRQAEFDAMSGNYMKVPSSAALVSASLLPPLLGMSAHGSMDRLADMGQAFFGQAGHGHKVAYFSLANLKGSLISLAIGVLLYVVVVRRLLTGDKGNLHRDGAREPGMRYPDRWPSWLDLEWLLYRPLLEVALPGIGGAVCGFVDRYLVPAAVAAFLQASAVLCRAMDQTADFVVRAARGTTHSQIPWVADSTRRGKASAGAAPAFARCAREKRARLGKRILGIGEAVQRNGRLVEESFSFGLMLFAAGLCLTLGYLLLVFVRQ